jgi:MFS family permease
MAICLAHSERRSYLRRVDSHAGDGHSSRLRGVPAADERGSALRAFALALAVHNPVWGVTQPFAGIVAGKYGAGRVLIGGTILYGLGLVTIAHAATPPMMVLTTTLRKCRDTTRARGGEIS